MKKLLSMRFFRCTNCGHRMRFTGIECGHCSATKEMHQQPAVIWAVVLSLLSGSLYFTVFQAPAGYAQQEIEIPVRAATTVQ